MSPSDYYAPAYYQPLQSIRQVANLLGIDVEEAAMEWHEWFTRHRSEPDKRAELLSDYLYAGHEAEEAFSEYLFANSAEARRGHRYSRIANPHPQTGASILIAQLADRA